MSPLADDILKSVGILDAASDAEAQSLIDRALPQNVPEGRTQPGSLSRMADLLEGQALASEGDVRVGMYGRAFSCWKLLALEPANAESLATHGNLSGDLLAPQLSIAFHLAATGMLAERVSEAQQALAIVLPDAQNAPSAGDPEPGAWKAAVLNDVALALCLLVRKDHGWEDINKALSLMAGLREMQASVESDHLDGVDASEVDKEVIELIACYHLAQMVTSSGEFIATGGTGSNALLNRLDRHRDQALEAASLVSNGVIARLVRLARDLCAQLVRNSIWTQVEGLGADASTFARHLADQALESPLLELWPSQQHALRSNLLDTYSRAVLVQMPTSAGKTLLAKFSIIQTLALNPGSTVAYVVPTRVLVNQVIDELRRDLKGLELTVEQAIPVFELDPTESQILSEPPSVLVTTPEKLDLLIRENHPALSNLSQVVVDEAHNLGEGPRGARLELLLATVRRDRPEARFLMLSPFLPNSQEIVEWLGDERALTPIAVNWRPNKKIVGAVEIKSHGFMNHDVVLRTVDSVDHSDLQDGIELKLSHVRRKPNSLKQLTKIAATSLRERGGVTLVVCYGKARSMERAAELADQLPDSDATGLIDTVTAHLHDELGANNALAPLLRKGVAYHHAGMSLETRRLVEHLVQRGDIHTVAGTTTLSQGVNFPINNVIVESRQKGREGAKLSYSDFWNTAGRAGRGRLSDLGVVAFPVVTDTQREDWNSFFAGEAEAIASQLATLVRNADDISLEHGFESLYNYEALSPFLQYLAHAMKVSGADLAAGEIEDLLRSSLVYRQAQAASEETAARLVRLCRDYLQEISGKTGLVALADGTGFSTPSVSFLRARAEEAPGLTDLDSWNASRLFGQDSESLTTRIDLLSKIPEIQLGQDEQGPFNPERVAHIIRDWVNGRSIPDMISEYGDPNRTELSRSTQFTSYLYSSLTGKVSWGMGALQRVAWAGQDGEVSDEAAHVPSMIFYGVGSKEAVWMRMAGLPREAAARAAGIWKEAHEDKPPKSYAEIRSFVDQISTDSWEENRGESEVSGEQMKLLWRELH